MIYNDELAIHVAMLLLYMHALAIVRSLVQGQVGLSAHALHASALALGSTACKHCPPHLTCLHWQRRTEVNEPSAQAHNSASASPPEPPRRSMSAGAAGSTAAPSAPARLASAHAASTAVSADSGVCWLPPRPSASQAWCRSLVL